MKLNKIMLALVALTASGGAFAHGYMVNPPSRDFLCHSDSKKDYPGMQNTDCGQVQYEPQSNGETADGFPAQGPKDGKLASGEWWSGAAMDVQTADRWQKVKMQPGPQQFSWKMTAQHPDKDFKYYITKEGWDRNAVLARDQLELEPFCVIPGSNSRQPGYTHTCDVPERSGYHVIYGAWDVSDTPATFYKTVDVEFEDNYEGAWSRSMGSIEPQVDLLPGSTVTARVFDNTGERPELSVTLDINSTEEGLKKNWSHALASKINQQNGELRAGTRGNDDTFTPVYGNNPMYTTANSSLQTVVIDPKPVEAGEVGNITINGMQSEYQINEQNRVIIGFELAVEGKLALEGDVFDANGKSVANFENTQEDNTKGYSLGLEEVKPGTYTLVVVGTNEKGQAVQSKSEFKLRGEAAGYEYVYPEGLKDYKAGTVVLQPENGKVYECVQGSAAGWCTQNNDAYKPGTGWAWNDAWIEKQ